MTLIEFLKEARAIYAAAGLIGRVGVTAETSERDGEPSTYGYRVTAHTQFSTMVTSWSDGFPYDCNNPALALERFKIACENATRPAAEPVAIGDIEATNEDLVVEVSKDAHKHYQAAVDAIGEDAVIITGGSESQAPRIIGMHTGGDVLGIYVSQDELDSMKVIKSKHAPTEESEVVE